jgi:ubiquinone biosynthesis protein
MNENRARRIEVAVTDGVRRWRRVRAEVVALPAPPAQPMPAREVVRAMPRRKLTHSADTAHVSLPMARRTVFKPGVIRPLVRLFVWLLAVARFLAGNGLDWVLRRGSVQRRAVRLRRIFEEAGPFFAKLGQQLSVRADILAYPYCAELTRMLDQVPSFPTAEAIAIIERSLGRPLGEVFAMFDPNPIGSASLSCVYQARLKTGERVAVKVRRPGIGPVLAADLQVMNWLLVAAEILTIIRPGQTKEFRQNLGSMLLGELNFRTEARYTEMFRLRAEKEGDGLTAPRVFFEFCTEEVLVNELVSGIWMWELMAAVDGQDHAFLAYAHSLGIEPATVGRRLVRGLHRQLLEHLYFHADPHPANLVVLPDSRICFIDFGAVGRFSSDARNVWRELHHHLRNGDIERMVACSMSLAGRLPPIDVDHVIKALEQIYTEWVYAVSSTDAEWWERSTALNWFRYINIAREQGLPVSLETIQFFRASLLYDSIVVRLDKNIDPVAEWTSYTQVAGKEARRRVRKFIRKRLEGPTRSDYLQMEQVADLVNQFFFRFQRNLSEPIIQFRNIVGKIAYIMSVTLWLAYVGGAIVGLSLIAQFVAERWFHRPIPWFEIAEWFTSFGWVQILLLLVALVIIRRILIRISEPDRHPEYGGR